MNEYCWFLFHHCTSLHVATSTRSEAEGINLSFSVTICQSDKCCEGRGAIIWTQAFGRQQAQSVSRSSANILSSTSPNTRGWKMTNVSWCYFSTGSYLVLECFWQVLHLFFIWGFLPWWSLSKHTRMHAQPQNSSWRLIPFTFGSNMHLQFLLAHKTQHWILMCVLFS